MTVEEARAAGVCRICNNSIRSVPGQPVGWQMEFGERVFPPPALTLKFGDEFAHTACLPVDQRHKPTEDLM